MAMKPGLGKGLDVLLSSAKKANQEVKTESKDISLQKLPVEKIVKGQYQPRINIDPDALQNLADSIKAQGLVQPVVVRKVAGDKYELIAGERRWRASQIAGLHEIPTIIREIPDQAAAAMSLIENIQREDLNPLEEANAMQRLIDEFGLTQQQTAEAVGRSRPAVANLLRLLELGAVAKELLDQGEIDMGHARAILVLPEVLQAEIAAKVAAKGMSVRDTEKLVKRLLNPPEAKAATTPSPEVQKLEQNLGETLGANVKVSYNNRGKGKLVIEYNSLDELDGILDHIN